MLELSSVSLTLQYPSMYIVLRYLNTSTDPIKWNAKEDRNIMRIVVSTETGGTRVMEGRDDHYPVVLLAAMVRWMHPQIRSASLIELSDAIWVDSFRRLIKCMGQIKPISALPCGLIWA
jgi:hypothetical protein